MAFKLCMLCTIVFLAACKPREFNRTASADSKSAVPSQIADFDDEDDVHDVVRVMFENYDVSASDDVSR